MVNSSLQWSGMVGAERDASGVAIAAPSREDAAQRRQGLRRRSQAQALDLAGKRRRQRRHEAGDRLEEAVIGRHRRHDDAQSGLAIAARRGGEPVEARHRELEEQIVASRRAGADEVEPAEQAAQILVLERAVTIEVGPGIEQQLEVPDVAHAFGEGAMTMRVGIDEPGHEKAVGGIDETRTLRHRQARRADLGNAVAGEKDVGGDGLVAGDVEDDSAANDGMGRDAHGF